MKFNCVPSADINKIFVPSGLDENLDLKTNLMGLKFNHPIGLGPGIDNLGNMISNLNRLGFEFIEVGPVADESEVTIENTKSTTEFIAESNPPQKSILIKNNEYLYSYSQSLSSIQSEIYKILSNKNNPNHPQTNLSVSTNIKLSNKSSRSAPYMADTLFVNMIKSSLLLSDFVTINLSSYTNKTILQYRNLNKLEILLNKIKEEVYYDMGVKSVIDHEHAMTDTYDQIKISDYMSYPVHLLKKNRVRLLLRLDTELGNKEIIHENYLKNLIDLIKKNGIIDGFVVGGMVKDKNTNLYNFYTGFKSKEISLELLKNLYKYTKGDIPIISTGGILTGEDVYERLRLGADFVLIYTPFLLRGPHCLEGIITEFKKKMNEEGKKKIKEIKIKS